ncbi:MAG: YcxB family protein [Thiobacillus sp.]|nr:YcxB family protein [Thiobacillus sp.]
MNYETTLTYSEPLIRQAVFAFWRRSVGVGFLVALLLIALGLAFYLARGEVSWVVGVLGTVFTFGVLFIVALYFVHYRNSLAKFRDMGSPYATFRADHSSFTISADSGTATLQWAVVKELWQTPNVWLLLYSKAHFSTLPVACLSPEMQSFILQRIQAAGGKIVG